MSSAVSSRIVEAIVGLGHALVAGDHERGAVVVVGLARGIEFGRCLEVRWKRKSFEDSFDCVNAIIFHRGLEQVHPRLMNSAL